MTHERAKSLLLDLAYAELSPDEAREVERNAAECASCAAELEGLLATRRLAARQAHFMPASLLDSQFADLEEPQTDEPHMRVDAGPPPDVIARGISRELGLGDHLESDR